ncbi:MAG: type IV pilus biogenesis/stability protein PilW [Pseudomonadota bacterium]|nr:type IV pilus biogenesis/stability protein PilW [Pseudomonadota bacterium]
MLRFPTGSFSVRLLALALLMGLLSGCVTTKNSPFPEADRAKAQETYLDLAVAYLEEEDTANAKEAVKKALKLDDRNPRVYTTLAHLFQYEGEDALAEAQFKKAIRLDPKYPPARNNYGVFLIRKGRYAEALEQLEVVAESPLYERRHMAYENMGIAATELGQTSDAVQYFEKALQLNDALPRSMLELASLQLQQGDAATAQALLDRYRLLIRLRRAQHTPGSLLLGVRIAEALQDGDGAASQALLLKELFPDSDEYRQYRANRSAE